MEAHRKAILFYNPKSGQNTKNHPRSHIKEFFDVNSIEVSIVEVPLLPAEVKTIVDQSISEGFEIFAVAGGDGTVSLIGDSFINTGKSLGIIPLGTGNLLAKTLGIPMKLDPALSLIISADQEILKMDALKLGDRHYISNVSVGVTPKIMKNTCQEDKQRLGFFAYLINFTQQILGLKLHRYYLEYDHKQASYLASEVLITNGRATGINTLEWSDNISVSDGVLDILIIRAANIYDILHLIVSVFTKREQFNPIIKKFTFRHCCQIDSKNTVPVQADGDVIGKTPVEVQLIPNSLNIIVKQ